MAETETAGLNEARLAAIEAHVARRHAAGAFHGHTADGEWWSVLEEYQRDTTALVAEVRRLSAEVWANAAALEAAGALVAALRQQYDRLDDAPPAVQAAARTLTAALRRALFSDLIAGEHEA